MEAPSLVDVLNTQFGIENHLHFKLGQGDLPMAYIQNEQATAVISLYAAHIMSYIPTGEEDVLWMSEKAVYQTGRPIRGGIPVIWPWFGPHPSDSTKPPHGFVRRQMWSVQSTKQDENGRTHLTLGLSDNEATRADISHDFTLELRIVVGAALDVQLVVKNDSDAPFTYTAALHTYFKVSDIRHVAIRGLEDVAYLDNLEGLSEKEPAGVIRFAGEVDRIYVETTAVSFIDDPELKRTIVVDKNGSHSTVVWNPWIAKAQQMRDFGDDEYLQMVCVETTNAAGDKITLAPNESATLQAIITAVNYTP